MIYANYNSTAPVKSGVYNAMRPYLEERFGNPSELNNPFGRVAAEAVESARLKVATVFGCRTSEVVFTAGGSESCFLALAGALTGNKLSKLLISNVEHPAIKESAAWLKDEVGIEVNRIPLSKNEGFPWEWFEEELEKEPGLVSVMLANNETGTIYPIKQIAKKAKEHGWLVHSDAVQAAGKIEVSFEDLGVDLLSVCAHKLGGPKGVGALLIKDETKFKSPLKAGGQEDERRGGTTAVSQIVGFSEALKDMDYKSSADKSHCQEVFEKDLFEYLPHAELNLDFELPRLSNTSNIYIPDVVGFELVEKLAEHGVVISAGSACASEQLKPSEVLLALGYTTLRALGSIRVSFGPASTKEEAEAVAGEIAERAIELKSDAMFDLKRRLVQ